MENSIEVSTEFDFKGKSYRPAVVLNLDEMMQGRTEKPDFHQMLAMENNIGFYSYEYEVLESCELVFASPTGLAVGFVQDGRFDFEGFRRHWTEQQELMALQSIASRCLGVDDLAKEPSLHEALLEAYRLGKEA